MKVLSVISSNALCFPKHSVWDILPNFDVAFCVQQMQLLMWKLISWRQIWPRLTSTWKTFCLRAVMETSCLFPSAHSEDAIHSRPQCHLLARKSVGDFFPTNCRHAWHPHCGSCSYIQTLTSAVCFPNMCTHPVKPKHCVLVVIQWEKQFKTLLLLTGRFSPTWVKCTGSIQTNA